MGYLTFLLYFIAQLLVFRLICIEYAQYVINQDRIENGGGPKCQDEATLRKKYQIVERDADWQLAKFNTVMDRIQFNPIGKLIIQEME